MALFGAITRSTLGVMAVFVTAFSVPVFGLFDCPKRSYVDSITRTGDVFGPESIRTMSVLGPILLLTVFLSWQILSKLALKHSLKIIYGV